MAHTASNSNFLNVYMSNHPVGNPDSMALEKNGILVRRALKLEFAEP